MNHEHLRLIANPYLLNKNNNNHNKIKKISKDKDEDLLKSYLENRYKYIYIHPILIQTIIQGIDIQMNNFIIEKIAKQFVDKLLNKCIAQIWYNIWNK